MPSKIDLADAQAIIAAGAAVLDKLAPEGSPQPEVELNQLRKTLTKTQGRWNTWPLSDLWSAAYEVLVNTGIGVSPGRKNLYPAPARSQIKLRIAMDAAARLSQPPAPPFKWEPLSAPWRAPNLLTVEPVNSVKDLMALGAAFVHPMRDPGVAEFYAGQIALGREQIVRIVEDGTPISWVELSCAKGKMIALSHSGYDKEQPSLVCHRAAEAYVKAVNAGDVELAFDLGEEGFVAKQPAPTP